MDQRITLEQLIGFNMFTDLVFSGKSVDFDKLNFADDVPDELIVAWRSHIEAAKRCAEQKQKLIEVAKKYGVEPSPLK